MTVNWIPKRTILMHRRKTNMKKSTEAGSHECADIGRHRLLKGAAGIGFAAALGPIIGLRPAMAQGQEPLGSVTFLSAENLLGKWDPYNHTLLSQIRPQAAAFDSLVHTDAEGKFIPGLATEWSNPEPNIWEFKLREGVVFHDGTPFTGKDVKASIEYISNPEQVGSFFFPNPFTVEVVDD